MSIAMLQPEPPPLVSDAERCRRGRSRAATIEQHVAIDAPGAAGENSPACHRHVANSNSAVGRRWRNGPAAAAIRCRQCQCAVPETAAILSRDRTNHRCACRPSTPPSPPGRRRHGAGHDRDRVRHRVVLRVDHGDAPAEPVDVDAVGDLEHMRHVVADQDDRQAAPLHVEHQLEHLARFLDAERRRRLVHDDDAAAEGRGPRHRHALALAAGQRLDRLVDVLDGQQAELVELLRAPRFCIAGAVEQAEAARPSSPASRRSRPRNRLSAIDSAGDSARFW